MKSIISVLAFIAFTSQLWGQCPIEFTYDVAGNRVKRVRITCFSGGDDGETFALKSSNPSTNGKPVSKMALKAYPNPNNGFFNVDVESPQENSVFELFDVAGRIVHTQTVKSETNPIDVSKLNAGTYILICRTPNNSVGNLKVVIE